MYHIERGVTTAHARDMTDSNTCGGLHRLSGRFVCEASSIEFLRWRVCTVYISSMRRDRTSGIDTILLFLCGKAYHQNTSLPNNRRTEIIISDKVFYVKKEGRVTQRISDDGLVWQTRNEARRVYLYLTAGKALPSFLVEA